MRLQNFCRRIVIFAQLAGCSFSPLYLRAKHQLQIMKNPLFCLIAAMFVLLAACKTDNGSEESGGDARDAAPITTIDTEEALRQLNDLRRLGCSCGMRFYDPVPPLRWNPTLVEAAQAHAMDMYEREYFSHTSLAGSSPGQRVRDAGYEWKLVAENIAQGQSSIEKVVIYWANSPAHCVNIMKPEFRDVGVARAGDYWVQVLGKNLFSVD